MANVLTSLLDRIPRQHAERLENAARIEGSYEALVANLRQAITDNFPQEAALMIAMQLSGIENVNAVMDRIGNDALDRVVRSIASGSETMPQLVSQTRFATQDETRDLLARILRGEMDKRGQTPRSVVALIERMGKDDLELLLRLRRVMWYDVMSYIPLNSPTKRMKICCMHESADYPGVLNYRDLARLSELGLTKFGALPFYDKYSPGASRFVEFGNEKLAIINTREADAQLETGHWDLTEDGRYLLGLYEKNEVEMLEDEVATNKAAWKKQGFNVADHDVIII